MSSVLANIDLLLLLYTFVYTSCSAETKLVVFSLAKPISHDANNIKV